MSRLAWAAAGVLAGFLLLWAYYAFPAELARELVGRHAGDTLRALFDGDQSRRTAANGAALALRALPGALLLGGLLGVVPFFLVAYTVYLALRAPRRRDAG